MWTVSASYIQHAVYIHPGGRVVHKNG